MALMWIVAAMLCVMVVGVAPMATVKIFDVEAEVLEDSSAQLDGKVKLVAWGFEFGSFSFHSRTKRQELMLPQ
jgi:hypothetical protein